MALLTRPDTLIKRRGEQVNVYRRTLAGVDEYNRPEYTWAIQYTLGVYMRVDDVKSDEEIYEAGELIVADKKAYPLSDEDILKDDQIVYNGERFDVIAIHARRHTAANQFKVIYLRRLIEQ